MQVKLFTLKSYQPCKEISHHASEAVYQTSKHAKPGSKPGPNTVRHTRVTGGKPLHHCAVILLPLTPIGWIISFIYIYLLLFCWFVCLSVDLFVCVVFCSFVCFY